MKTSRRALLAASVGAAQLALLERFGLLRDARADTGDGPSRLLVLYLQGGTRFQTFFCPFTADEVGRYIPPPASAAGEPVFFKPEQLIDLAPASTGSMPLRLAKLWNPSDPGDRGQGFLYTPMGYGWLHHELASRTVALHGINHGSVAHASAYVSSMCGIAGEEYRAPAALSVVANHFHQKFGDKRPLPCVAIRAQGAPSALNLPSISSPAIVPDLGTLTAVFSSDGARTADWKGHDARAAASLPTFSGEGAPIAGALTDVDAYVLGRTRALKGKSTTGNDAALEQLYNGYVAVSSTLARDVVAAVEKTNAFDSPVPPYLESSFGRLSFTFGYANGLIDMKKSLEWTLRVLKSGIATSVYAYLPEVYYDTHSGDSWGRMTASLRAQMDMVAQVLGELKATPSPDRPGKSLYDDTVVLVTSEFGRTWAVGPNQSSTDGWRFGDDHNAISSVILSGGAITGNQQIGGFANDGEEGKPVGIVEETGEKTTRLPRSADVMATLYRSLGMVPGKDFFLPGGYGEIAGVVPT
jgi:hypothetical protein